MNPRTGKIERVFVNLDAVYPNADDISEEYSFEELRAKHRGWLSRNWRQDAVTPSGLPPFQAGAPQQEEVGKIRIEQKDEVTTLEPPQQDASTELTGDQTISDITESRDDPKGTKAPRGRRKKVMEVKGETQTSNTTSTSLPF